MPYIAHKITCDTFDDEIPFEQMQDEIEGINETKQDDFMTLLHRVNSRQ
jgi:uncharacterized protein with NAD-binding domain and iron-sulfur cluster